MHKGLGMNRELGTKWFTFYTKVRPWFACISALASIAQFAEYSDIYIRNIGLLVAFAATLTNAVLSIIVAIKADDDYGDFVVFVKRVLLFEILSMAYQTVIQQYYENGYDLPTSTIVGAVILLMAYLCWYRPNVKYFKKRLNKEQGAEVATTAPQQISVNEFKDERPLHYSLSEAGEVSKTYGNYHVYGSDIMLMDDMRLDTAYDSVKQPHSNSHREPETTVRCYASDDQDFASVSKKCESSEKINHRGSKRMTVAFVIMALIAVTSLVGNIILLQNNTALNNRIADLQNNNAGLITSVDQFEERIFDLQKENYFLEAQIEDSEEKLQFYDEYVVFVKNGTQTYHHYDCDKFINDYNFWLNDGVFWAFNIDAAIYEGYTACGFCGK